MATKLFPVAKKVAAAIADTVGRRSPQQIVEETIDLCSHTDGIYRLGIGDMRAIRVSDDPENPGVRVRFDEEMETGAFSLRLTELKNGDAIFCLCNTCIEVNPANLTSFTTQRLERLISEIENHRLEKRRWMIAALSGLIEAAPWTGFELSPALETRISKLVPDTDLPADGTSEAGWTFTTRIT